MKPTWIRMNTMLPLLFLWLQWLDAFFASTTTFRKDHFAKSPPGAIKQMLAPEFERYVKSQNTYPVSMVEFYSPACGHCKAMEPEYAKAAKKMLGVIPFIAIDCTAGANNVLCSQYQIKGYPTLRIMALPGFTRAKFAVKWHDYQGSRTADAMLGAVQSHYPGTFSALKEKTLAGLAEKLDKRRHKPKALLFSLDGRIAFDLKRLSLELANKMDFLLIEAPSVELKTMYGVSSLPAFVIVQPDGQQLAYVDEKASTRDKSAPKLVYKRLAHFCQQAIGVPAFTDLLGFRSFEAFSASCLQYEAATATTTTSVSLIMVFGDRLQVSREPNKRRLALLQFLEKQIEAQKKPYRVHWMDEAILESSSQCRSILSEAVPGDCWMLIVNSKKRRYCPWKPESEHTDKEKDEQALQSLLQDISMGQLPMRPYVLDSSKHHDEL